MNTLINLFGRQALEQRDILNEFYADIITLRHDSIQSGITLIEALLAFGTNHLTVDYYFAILVLMHTASLNRENIQRASQLELYMHQYLVINKNKSQTA